MRIALLAAAMGTSALAGPAQAQTVNSGIEAWQRGDHGEAVANWRPLAEKGDADAAFNLGQAYRLGRGVELNLGAAQQWLDRAARKDHLDAQVTLGLLLFDSGNRQGGLRWLKTAADRGEPRALLVYGTALFNGDGIPRDPVLAYAMVSRAAAQGLAPAKSTLAQMDRVLPVDQRRKGVALALEKAKPEPARAGPEPAARKAEAPAPKPSLKAEATARPQSPPAPAQKASPAKTSSAGAHGRWRIQLGAFSKRASAESLYRKLSGSEPVAGLSPSYVEAGKVIRLQVGPFESRAAASAACKALSAKGQACFPVER